MRSPRQATAEVAACIRTGRAVTDEPHTGLMAELNEVPPRDRRVHRDPVHGRSLVVPEGLPARSVIPRAASTALPGTWAVTPPRS